MSTDVSGIIDRLRQVSEDLGDKALAVLTDAVTSGATTRPSEERTITQAKRSVEKAIALLERL